MECSVYIGNEAIHAVMGRAGRKGVQIERVCSEPLAPGAVIGGVFIDEAAVKAALCSLWGRSHLPQRGVRLVVGVGGARSSSSARWSPPSPAANCSGCW